MNFVCVNGSPRKKMNSDIMITAIGERLGDLGHEIRRFDLHDLTYKGCSSCFACKRIGKPSFGHCVVNDGLKPLLDEIRKADGLFLASPIYFNDVSGEVHSFLERLLFQYTVYTKPISSSNDKQLKMGFVYSMNVSREIFEKSLLKDHLSSLETRAAQILGVARSHFSYSTNQLANYEGIEYSYFEPVERKRQYEERLPDEIARVREFAEALVLA